MSTTVAAGAESAVIRIHPADDVVIARRQLLGGTRVDSEGITVSGLIPPGPQDRGARRSPKGAPVRRYNQIIGFATQGHRARPARAHAQPGVLDFERAHASASACTPPRSSTPPATFMGIVRDDGRIATRNYIGVLTSVNCSATAARAIADQFRRDIHPEALADYPNVDGVVALTHGAGCATDQRRRRAAGVAAHARRLRQAPQLRRRAGGRASAARPTRSTA